MLKINDTLSLKCFLFSNGFRSDLSHSPGIEKFDVKLEDSLYTWNIRWVRRVNTHRQNQIIFGENRLLFQWPLGKSHPLQRQIHQRLSSDLTSRCCFDFSQTRATQIQRAQILSVPTVATIIITAKHTRPTALPVRPLKYWKMHSSTFRFLA